MSNSTELKNNFQYVLDHYIDNAQRVDSSTLLYASLCREIPKLLRIIINRKEMIVKGSMGAGNRTKYPWVSILNSNLTTSTQRGLYVVFLFKADMSGFYLTLNQGITHFENLYKSKKYHNAKKVASYFRSQIEDTSFNDDGISLGSTIGDLGYGYEKTTVLSRFYPSNNFSGQMIIDDLKEMMEIYDLIVKHMDSQSYDKVIQDVLADEQDKAVRSDDALEKIKEAVDPDEELPFGFVRRLTEVEPLSDRSVRFRRMTAPKIGKIDYLKKAAKDAKTGLIGEELVLRYERERLTELGHEELVDEIKWIAQQSDSYGYDIESFEIINGTVVPIKVEVKTTSSRVDTEFYVSKNELETSNTYKEQYCVYRVYDVNSQNPKFYRAFGKFEDNFVLDPVTYMARYKY